jgi:ornithine cyclodeaminase
LVSPGGAKLTSLIMPAWLPGRYYGIKTINIAPGNAARGLPGLHASYVLFDANTGVPLALIDGDQLTTRRTAAASALGASWLARPDARHLLVVGAGQVARLLPDAFRAVRPIDRVTVWARAVDKAEALADELRGHGFVATAARDLEAAVGEADIVSCATLAGAPVVQGRWLRPGSHLDLIGSFTPAMREADDDCFAGAALYVDTEEALQKSGDLLGPMSRGVFGAADVRGTLATLARGEASGRRTREERTVFKSVGTALEDLAAAIRVFEAH